MVLSPFSLFSSVISMNFSICLNCTVNFSICQIFSFLFYNDFESRLDKIKINDENYSQQAPLPSY